MEVRVSIIVVKNEKHYLFIKNEQGQVVAAFEIAAKRRRKFDRIVLGPKVLYKILVSQTGTKERALPIGLESLVHRLVRKYDVFPAIPVPETERVMEIQPRYPRVRPVASTNPKRKLAKKALPSFEAPRMVIVQWNQKKIQQEARVNMQKTRVSMREVSRQLLFGTRQSCS